MTGTVNIYIPRSADGSPMTGPVPKGQRARATKTRGTDVRTYFDPLAGRNLSNAIAKPPKPKPYNPRIAPSGWSLRPLVDCAHGSLPFCWECGTDAEPSTPPVDAPAETPTPAVVAEVDLGEGFHCGKRFRTPNGFAWHMLNIHPVAA